MWDIYRILYIIFHFLVRNIGCGIDKAILDPWELYELVDDRVDFSYVHIRYYIGYVYHICLQDTIQSTQLLSLLCQAMLLPMPLLPLLLSIRSGFNNMKGYVQFSLYAQRAAAVLAYMVELETETRLMENCNSSAKKNPKADGLFQICPAQRVDHPSKREQTGFLVPWVPRIGICCPYNNNPGPRTTPSQKRGPVQGERTPRPARPNGPNRSQKRPQHRHRPIRNRRQRPQRAHSSRQRNVPPCTPNGQTARKYREYSRPRLEDN